MRKLVFLLEWRAYRASFFAVWRSNMPLYSPESRPLESFLPRRMTGVIFNCTRNFLQFFVGSGIRQCSTTKGGCYVWCMVLSAHVVIMFSSRPSALISKVQSLRNFITSSSVSPLHHPPFSPNQESVLEALWTPERFWAKPQLAMNFCDVFWVKERHLCTTV